MSIDSGMGWACSGTNQFPARDESWDFISPPCRYGGARAEKESRPMNQVLFWIPVKTNWTPPGIPVYGFGLMLFLAFVISTYLAGRRAERQGIPGERMQDLILWIFV